MIYNIRYNIYVFSTGNCKVDANFTPIFEKISKGQVWKAACTKGLRAFLPDANFTPNLEKIACYLKMPIPGTRYFTGFLETGIHVLLTYEFFMNTASGIKKSPYSRGFSGFFFACSSNWQTEEHGKKKKIIIYNLQSLDFACQTASFSDHRSS